jgi:hypothetical protein
MMTGNVVISEVDVLMYVVLSKEEKRVPYGELLYILESNPHPFYSFRGLKNQMRIRFAVESWILEKMIELLYVL